MSFIVGGHPAKPIKAVLFDMDGLLIDSERLSVESDLQALADMGLSIDRSVLLSTLGETDTACNQILQKADPRFDSDLFWKKTQRYYQEHLNAGQLSAKEGARELLDALCQEHIPYALASSSSHSRIALSLSACGLEDRFSVIACGDDSVRSKPAPDIFLLAAERLGIPPVDCLVLEDSFNGIRAGTRSGMQVCMVPDLVPFRPEWRSYVTHVCTTLLDVIHLVSGKDLH